MEFGNEFAFIQSEIVKKILHFITIIYGFCAIFL